MGAALAFGNFMALVRPRAAEDVSEGDLERPPLGWSLAMIAIGLVLALWALASLTADDPEATTSASEASVIITR